MGILRRVGTALLGMALLLAIAVAGSRAASNVYFMAVNERFVEMTPENMPMSVNGALYVPYIMLSIQHTGINLGVSAQYNASRQTTLVSDGFRSVVFDLQSNTAYDAQGNPVNARAVMRNAMVFLPLAWVCSYFGLTRYTTNWTPYGTLVRLTNSSVVLSDADFLDAADGLLRDNLASYQQAISQQNQPSSASPSQPQPEPSEPPDSGSTVYLAFLWGDTAQAIAEQMSELGTPALFLFTPEQLAQQDSLVRQLVGAGHSVGLDLTGNTVAQCLQQAQQGSQLLADIARCPAYLVRADGLDQAQRAQLEQAGWAVWSATVRWDAPATAYQLLGRLSGSRANYVEAVCDSQGHAALSAALQALTGEGYRLLPTLATDL